MSHAQSPDVSTRSVVEILFRHKKKVLLCPIFAVALGALIFILCPRTYRSEARVFLRVGRESVGLDPTATTGNTIPLQQADRKDEIKSALEVCRSRNIVAQAVDQLGPDVVLGRAGIGAKKASTLADAIGLPVRWIVNLVKSIDPISDREEAIVQAERHLNIGAERESTVIVVQYDAATPQLAQAVCNAVVEVYQREHTRIHRSEESRPFFAEQQERLRQQLDNSLEAVRNAKNELGLSSVEQRRATLEAEFGAVQLDRLSTEQQLATAEAHIEDLVKQLNKVPERLIASKKSIPNQGADLLREQLYALQVKSMDLEARYSESHPLVKAVNDQLNEAKQVLAQQSDERMETTDNVNPIHRDLSLKLKNEQTVAAGCKARLAELGKQKEGLLAELRTVNDCDLKIDQLDRQVELARSKYFQYARNLEEARIDKDLEYEGINNLSIVQAATLAEKPVSPSRIIVALATLMLATAGTGALVLASEQLHQHRDYHSDRQNGTATLANVALGRRRVQHRELAVKANGHANP